MTAVGPALPRDALPEALGTVLLGATTAVRLLHPDAAEVAGGSAATGPGTRRGPSAGGTP
jgi:hypothetical protein